MAFMTDLYCRPALTFEYLKGTIMDVYCCLSCHEISLWWFYALRCVQYNTLVVIIAACTVGILVISTIYRIFVHTLCTPAPGYRCYTHPVRGCWSDVGVRRMQDLLTSFLCTKQPPCVQRCASICNSGTQHFWKKSKHLKQILLEEWLSALYFHFYQIICW